jgi:hypothetical protein
MRISDGDGNPFDAPHPAASSDLAWSRTQASILVACTRLARENQPSRRPSKNPALPRPTSEKFQMGRDLPRERSTREQQRANPPS